MKFCAASGGGNELEKLFSALSLNTSQSLIPKRKAPQSLEDHVTHPSSEQPGGASIPTALPSITGTTPSPELQLILMGMRKLREAIVASRRHDTFAQRSYIFIIRACILVAHWESYQPALTYLLHEIHPLTPLPMHELNEFMTYQILDSACRQNDLHTAFLLKYGYGVQDRRVESVLKSLVRDDWVTFWKTRKRVDGYQRSLMGFSEDLMRVHALKCLGKGYFTADKEFVERVADQQWPELVKSGVGWELVDGGTIIIRRPKGK
jgi:hypothetical protein